MKVIAINGSPNFDGNTSMALNAIKEELEKEKIEVEIIHVGREQIRGCIGCNYCSTSDQNLCVFKDDVVNDISLKMRKVDGLILASPTYYAAIAGTMKSFLDRIFYMNSAGGYFKYKIGATVGIARRAGAVEVFQQLNNYFQLAEVVIAPTQYWNIGYGLKKKEIGGDGEGLQTIRRSAKTMAWLLKMKKETQEMIPLPEIEDRVVTHFIR